MDVITRRLSRRRLILAAGSIGFILLAWWQILAAGQGLVSRSLTTNAGPARFIAPAGATNVPGVLIAHGFSGSQQLMLGYGHTLAQAGYGVMLWDFTGHGGNSRPMDDDVDLLSDLEAAYQALIAQPEIDAGRVALLGHSMGSGVVMEAGITDSDRYQATIAVSPTDAEVTATEPSNFMLQAGQLEPPFAANARGLLDRAGGENDDLAGEQGRTLVIVPLVEHITILFSATSHREATAWLNQSFGIDQMSAYVDRRMIWYLLQLLAWLLLITAVAPLITPHNTPTPQRRRSWIALGAGVVIAGVVLFLLSRLAAIAVLLGMLLAGTLALWFLLVGLVWLGASFQLTRPKTADLLWGLALFAFLWIAFGLLADVVWLPWRLIPYRLARWPVLAAACLPWLLATGLSQAGASRRQQFIGWAGQSGLLVGGLLLAIVLNPSLFFIVILMPVVPIILAVMAAAGSAIGRPWAIGLGNALFFGWLLAALFPLAS